MALDDLVTKGVSALIPPHDATPEEHYNWRLRIGLSVCFLFAALSAVTVFAFGLVPGVAGFARATDLNTVIGEIRQNRVGELDNRILELRIKHCDAKTDEAKQLYWAKIQSLVSEWRGLTGLPNYQLPACADL